MTTELQRVDTQTLAPQVSGEDRLIDLWVKHSDSQHTRRAYLRTVEEFLVWVGKPLAAVNIEDLQGYKEKLAASGFKAASVNQRLATVKSLLSYAYDTGCTRFNVGRAVKLLPQRSDLAARILEQPDLLRIIALESDARNHALLSLLYYSGARVSEVCALRWQDMASRKGGGQVTLYGKGGKTRSVRLPTRVWRLLEALRHDAAPDAPVFASRKGGHLDASQVHRIVTAAARRAGIAGNVSPHWFRHGHASHALDAGCPIHVLKDSLGHASLATTSRYTHARPSESSSDYLK